ncbi:hypothetical protein AYM40_25775 [Paraburkholderia phytofirmans OLGA172]|uniref:Uncharacterized protein n=1 Tax=Paraburkholderia phytofirmans OLGA172 TaxID=1417228 RepID=A0A160FSL2_9BURK|nr:hypothetical protein AYM40_25775 [Paraburkholderia phytofirmans OLGA172]
MASATKRCFAIYTASTRKCGSRASAAARLERLPFSGYHRILFIIIAIAFFFDSVNLGTMTFVLGSIKTEFHLSTAAAALNDPSCQNGTFARARYMRPGWT